MACTCNTAGGNTGVPFCSPLQGVMHSLIIVPKYANDGTLNAIDLANDTLDQAYFTGKINEANEKDRWYPLPFMENVENTRAEALNETANSGNIYRIKQGVRTLTGAFFKQPAQYLARLEKWLCIDFGVYEIDSNGALAGTLSADGTKLYPRYVLNGSLDPNYMYATDTTVGKNTISFQYDENVMDSEIGLILPTSMDNADLLNLNGLFDVDYTVSNITTTGFNEAVTLLYGDVLNKIKVEGLTDADFTLFNVTTSSAVIITSVTEVTAGNYAFVIPSQASADVLNLTLNKEGYANSVDVVTIP